MSRSVLVAALVAAALLLAGGPGLHPVAARADGPGGRISTWPSQATRTVLLLALHEGTDLTGRVLAEDVLTCSPPGGTHPHPVPVCTALRQVHGEIADLPPGEGICPMIFLPVTAEASGFWQGRWVEFVRTYANSCIAATSSDGLFELGH
jgi:Subtilisin inhibitor-like